MAVGAVLASFTLTQRGTGHTSLVAFTVLLEAETLLTIAALGVESVFRIQEFVSTLHHCVNFRLEGVGVALSDLLNSVLPRVGILTVLTVKTIALTGTSQTRSEAIAVELEAFGLSTIAFDPYRRRSLIIRNDLFDLFLSPILFL
jgi:hypothetical protein